MQSGKISKRSKTGRDSSSKYQENKSKLPTITSKNNLVLGQAVLHVGEIKKTDVAKNMKSFRNVHIRAIDRSQPLQRK